jgi:hypothetical protein
MLDLTGHILGMIAILVTAIAVLSAIPLTLRQKLIAGTGAGAWVGVASALAASGSLAFSPEQPIPVIGVLFALPVATAAALWFLAPRFRAALNAIPLPLLIGLNSLRVFGFVFLALAFVGRLSGPFPYFAGLGDIITGVLAVPLALRVARGETASVRSWNAFGTLDLLLAVALGISSAQGSPLQVFHGGAGSQAMQALPFSLIPTVLVPFFLITHGLIAARISRRSQTVAAGVRAIEPART